MKAKHSHHQKHCDLVIVDESEVKAEAAKEGGRSWKTECDACR